MKKELLILPIMLLLVASISASMLITEQPQSTYSKGAVAIVPVKIIAENQKSGFLTASLVCAGTERVVHQEFVTLNQNQEKQTSINLPLIDRFVGSGEPTCTVKIMLDGESVTSNQFSIKSQITLDLTSSAVEVTPGEKLEIKGTARKESGIVNGIMTATLTGPKTIVFTDTVKEGVVQSSFAIADATAAGKYLVNVEVYEKDIDGNIATSGKSYYTLTIFQVPKGLELISELDTVTPGNSLLIKPILRDQTGEKIETNVLVTLKDAKGKILLEKQTATDTNFEYPTQKNQVPTTFTVETKAYGFSATKKLSLTELKEVKVEFVNDSVIIKNVGNVAYIGTVSVNVGETQIPINVSLDRDEEKKFKIEAPSGEYAIEVVSESGSFTGKAVLSGKTIAVKESSFFSQTQKTLFWAFIVALLGICTAVVMRTTLQKRFVTGFKQPKVIKEIPMQIAQSFASNEKLFKTRYPAEISLAIQGGKQMVTMVCLRIRNIESVTKNKQAFEELFKKITDRAETIKASIFENHDTFYFILTPNKTKTYKNELPAITFAQEMSALINAQNKVFKIKLDFGISVNNGELVTSDQEGVLQFIGMGQTLPLAKKIASISRGDVLIGEDAIAKIRSNVKTQKSSVNGVDFYEVREIKKDEGQSRFMRDFIQRNK